MVVLAQVNALLKAIITKASPGDAIIPVKHPKGYIEPMPANAVILVDARASSST